MDVDDFIRAPTKNNHPLYSSSLLSVTAAEYSTGEVILGSVYRRLLLGESEAAINLDDLKYLGAEFPNDIGGEDLWSTLLTEGYLGSPPPKRSRQRKQMMPLIPEIAKHACVLGGQRSRWNPSNLLLEAIGAGVGKEQGEALKENLGKALEVDIDDDVFARFVEGSFRKINNNRPIPAPYHAAMLQNTHISAFRGKVSELHNPAERFCKDLEIVIGQKDLLTRRQWTVLLEATLRIGLGMHLLWICQVNSTIWQLILRVTKGTLPPSEEEIESLLWQSHRETTPLLQVGGPAMPLIDQLIRAYVEARFGINLVLFLLDKRGFGWNQVIGFSTEDRKPAAVKIRLFLEHIFQNRVSIDPSLSAWLRENCAKLLEGNSALIKLESGFTKNMREFIRHSLGQIDAHNPEQTAYDQAYLIRNKSNAKRESLLSVIVVPGPAMLIALVNACFQDDEKNLASLEDLRMHFADYGLHVPAGELSGGQVGNDLQKLGLVVDSPDAAGGRLLVPPFDRNSRS